MKSPFQSRSRRTVRPVSDWEAENCTRADGRCPHPEMCQEYGCAQTRASLLEPPLTDPELEHDQKVFDAICTVWEHAVRSGLPDADRLRDELARLQEHCGLERRPTE